MKKNEIYIKSGTEYKDMTKELLEQCDLAEQISSPDLQIGIKPNLVSPTEASWGATTHPEIVAGIIEYLQEKGFAKIAILEGSWVGDKTTEAYELCGYRELSEKYQVPFWDMQKDTGVDRDCGGMDLKICSSVEKIDFLINVPVLKGHCQTKITCALKNMKGLIPNTEKRRFHALGLHKPIAHLNMGIHQDFIVVDNICGDLDFEDGGNPVVMNRIWAGMDPVLIDAYVCQVMHYQTSDVPYVKLAEELGAGSADLSQAEIAQRMGMTQTYFSRIFKNKTGKNFVSLLTEFRMNHAKELIAEEHEITIRELTEKCGYTSKTYFCALFRKTTGLTVNEYRRRIEDER